MWERVQQSNQFDVVVRMIQANPLTSLSASLAFGLLVGWMVLGWWVAPVQWENAGPAHLSDLYQDEWVQMSADSFALTLDVEQARQRVAVLDGEAASAVERALQGSRDADQLRIAQLQYGIGDTVQVAESEASKERGSLAPSEEASPGVGSESTQTILSALGGMLLIVLLSAGGLVMRRHYGLRRPVQSPAADGSRPNTRVSAYRGTEGEEEPRFSEAPPVARFMTTYMLGDNLYDDSFSIDDANGDFLGECGVGVSETIGVGDAKKVTAFEVWLFDKNDVRTVTKVLMSEHAFADDELRSRLAPKGSPVRACQGEMMVLDTASLHVTARIVDMQYGSGALPENSFFHQLTIELAAWKRGQDDSVLVEREEATLY